MKYVVEYSTLDGNNVFQTKLLSKRQFDRFLERFLGSEYMLKRIIKFNVGMRFHETVH